MYARCQNLFQLHAEGGRGKHAHHNVRKKNQAALLLKYLNAASHVVTAERTSNLKIITLSELITGPCTETIIAHAFLSYSFDIHFNIILLSTLKSSK